jgi:L-fucose isomerase-like protein
VEKYGEKMMDDNIENNKKTEIIRNEKNKEEELKRKEEEMKKKEEEQKKKDEEINCFISFYFFYSFILFLILKYLFEVNNISFDANNTGKLQINRLLITFNRRGEWVGTTLNYDITEGIYKMFCLFIFILLIIYNVIN